MASIQAIALAASDARAISHAVCRGVVKVTPLRLAISSLATVARRMATPGVGRMRRGQVISTGSLSSASSAPHSWAADRPLMNASPGIHIATARIRSDGVIGRLAAT